MWRDVVGGDGVLSKLLGYVTLVYSIITLANVPRMMDAIHDIQLSIFVKILESYATQTVAILN
jgi:hypothetical protein